MSTLALDPSKHERIESYINHGAYIASELERQKKEQEKQVVGKEREGILKEVKEKLITLHLPAGVLESSEMKKGNVEGAIREHIDAVKEQTQLRGEYWKVETLPHGVGGTYDPSTTEKTLDAEVLSRANKENTTLKEVITHEESHAQHFENLKKKNGFSTYEELIKNPYFQKPLTQDKDALLNQRLLYDYFAMDGQEKQLDPGEEHWVIEALNCLYDTQKNGSPIPEAYLPFVERMQKQMKSRGVEEDFVLKLYEEGYVAELSLVLGLPMIPC